MHRDTNFEYKKTVSYEISYTFGLVSRGYAWERYTQIM